jgi:hypothetical protein
VTLTVVGEWSVVLDSLHTRNYLTYVMVRDAPIHDLYIGCGERVPINQRVLTLSLTHLDIPHSNQYVEDVAEPSATTPC